MVQAYMKYIQVRLAPVINPFYMRHEIEGQVVVVVSEICNKITFSRVVFVSAQC